MDDTTVPWAPPEALASFDREWAMTVLANAIGRKYFRIPRNWILFAVCYLSSMNGRRENSWSAAGKFPLTLPSLVGTNKSLAAPIEAFSTPIPRVPR